MGRCHEAEALAANQSVEAAREAHAQASTQAAELERTATEHKEALRSQVEESNVFKRRLDEVEQSLKCSEEQRKKRLWPSWSKPQRSVPGLPRLHLQLTTMHRIVC